jgi:hypothetical protein
VDYDWAVLYYHEDTGPPDLDQWDADLVTTVRLSLFTDDRSGREASRALVDDIVRIASDSGPVYYLLVDVASMNETGADGIYKRRGTPILEGRCLARIIEKERWRELRQQRREYVRGVFWGNYLNARLLERLGGKESFRKRYLDFAKTTVREWSMLVTDTPAGGLFVRISRDPLDQSHHRVAPIGAENAVWLHRELRGIGALP